MINQYEVPACMVDELPEIKEELKSLFPAFNLYKSIQCLVDYTICKVQEHDFTMVKKCFATAEICYSKGNTIVKNAIENVYVYSFSHLMCLCSSEEKRELQGLMPLSLHTAYVQQVLKSGI